MKKLRSIYEFGRPHTLLATSFQVLGVFTVIIAGNHIEMTVLVSLFLAWAGSLSANLYVVGLNQLFDLDIDRINKPYLPLASHEISVRQGRLIVLAAGFASLIIGLAAGLTLLVTLVLVMLIGTIYSAPPLRLKVRAGWAALSISLARGLIANAGLYLYYEHAIQPAHILPRAALWLGLGFFFLFGLVIAIYKDIPDWVGDQKYRVRTFAVALGRERAFRLGRWILSGMYLLPVTAGLILLPGVGSLVLVLVHLAAWVIFLVRSRRTDPNEPPSMMRLYKLVWILFYAEYVFLGVYRLILTIT